MGTSFSSVIANGTACNTLPHTEYQHGEVSASHTSWACSHTGEDARICQLHLRNPEPAPQSGRRYEGRGGVRGEEVEWIYYPSFSYVSKG